MFFVRGWWRGRCLSGRRITLTTAKERQCDLRGHGCLLGCLVTEEMLDKAANDFVG
jgi:hypothetical protein